jgi:hypothetical protein
MTDKLRKSSPATCLLAMLLLCGILASVRESQAGPTSSWSSPQSLSGWQPEIDNYNYYLELGADGTQAAFWVTGNPYNNPWAIWARTRKFGQAWDQAESISLGQPKLPDQLYWDRGVAPDGTVWVIYASKDTSISGDNMFLFVAWRQPEGSWQRAKLSKSPAGQVRDARLTISQEGVLIVTWTESDSSSQPPFSLYAVMRYLELSGWEEPKRIDANWGNTKIRDVHPLIGPEGMAMVMWVETKPGDPLRAGVFWRTKDPHTGNWSAIPAVPISGWQLTNWFTLSEPAIGPDGNVVAAWRCNAPNPVNIVNYSSTYMAGSSTWSAAVPISTPRVGLGFPDLALSQNGTTIAAWFCEDAAKYAICVNVRDPGSTWEGEIVLSSWQKYPLDFDLGIWPDGGAMVVWDECDPNKPTGQKCNIHWNMRPPNGPWGALGSGAIGDPVEYCSMGSLKLSHDHYAQTIWGVYDASQPPDLQGAVFASTWNPGGPWEAPTRISNWGDDVWVYSEGLVVAPDGLTVAALWEEDRKSAPSDQVSYNQQIFLIPPEPSPTTEPPPTEPTPTEPSPTDKLIFLPLVMK